MIDGFVYTDTIADQRQILEILRPLRPMRVEGFGKTRVGRDYDGGYVMLDDFAGVTTAYSLGINDDVSWDLAMASRGIEIFQYDHTIPALPQDHPKFHWQKVGISHTEDGAPALRSLPFLIRENNHALTENMLLKIDIEGAEWDVFAAMPDDVLGQFSQIVCEFHGFQHVSDSPGFAARVKASVDKLAQQFSVIHVHGNNNTAYAIVGGIAVPAVIEISLARKRGRKFKPSFEKFPTELDMPCYPGRADYNLGTFIF